MPAFPPDHSRSGSMAVAGLRLRKLRSNIPGSINSFLQWGTVAAVHAGPPKTVDVTLNGSSAATTGIRYQSGYAPTVGDYVPVLCGGSGASDKYVLPPPA